jgi:redox-sensitive bicupin YhaK (pirin superfamily)
VIQVEPQDARYHFRNDWLSACWHFSFDHYYDPARVRFGALRVFNDDTVAPRSGFPLHPHRDMEIVTIVLAGTLEHEDNQGNRGVLTAGEVQVMSAASGIVHAERNPSPTVPLHLLQIWIEPAHPGGRPRWAQASYAPEPGRGPLVPVASGEGRRGALPIGQAATVYRGKLGPGEAVSHELAAGRRAYAFVIGGTLTANGHALKTADAARVEGEPALRFEADRAADLLLLDLP